MEDMKIAQASRVEAIGEEYAADYYYSLSDAGIDPEEKIVASTNISDVLDKMDGNIGAGFGYLGERAHAKTSCCTPAQHEIIDAADKQIHDAALRNGWDMSHLAVFADSKSGRHYGDMVFGGYGHSADFLSTSIAPLGLGR